MAKITRRMIKEKVKDLEKNLKKFNESLKQTGLLVEGFFLGFWLVF